MDASPLKLKDGSWGAKLEGARPELGATVTITTRGGKTWDATITAIVWSSPEGNLHYLRTRSDKPERPRPHHVRLGGRDYFRNARGRCEDAPCCGCCTI